MFLMSKTAQAFTWTAEKLAETFPELYFWTFTFKSVPICDSMAMQDWDTFHTRLCYHMKWMRGVRVCELHRAHGIHFHAIINGRIPIRRIQSLVYGSGFTNGRNRYLDFGRMTVDKCDNGTIGYLAKYLTKQYAADNNFGLRRRWGTIGGWNGTRVRDVVVEGPGTRAKEKLFGHAKIEYATSLVIGHYANMWGELDKWPREFVMRAFNAQTREDTRGKESMRAQLQSERIDASYLVWKYHLDSCGQCKYAERLCERGLKVWQDAIFSEWRFPERAEKSTADQDGNNVTLCNNRQEWNTVGVPFVSNRKGGLTNEVDAGGRKIYNLRRGGDMEKRKEWL